MFSRQKPKTSAPPDLTKRRSNRNNKKKGLSRFARRYALHLGALLVLAAITLGFIINQAKAGSYTVTPLTAATVVAQSMTGTPATDMDSDNGVYTAFREKSSTKQLDFDITMDPVTAQASKIYKASLTIDAMVSMGLDNINYYAKMYTGTTTTQDFGTGSLGAFTATDGANDSVTITENDMLKAQAFYNGAIANGNPKIKIQNGKSYNGTTDTTQSELSLDYVALTFYEDINAPNAGTLTPSSTQTDITPLKGSNTVTLAGVLDNASANESGVKEVQFYRSPYNQNNWTLINTDATADASNNYSVAWDTTQVTDGYYDLRAIAVDNVSNQKIVLSTHVRVQNSDVEPPTSVSITTPANGTRVNSPVITATALDNVGVVKVEFYDSTNASTPFATDNSPVGGWTATWDTSNTSKYIDGQSYEVWVKAYDAANNSTASAQPNKSYTIDRIAPNVESVIPADNSTNVSTDRPPITPTFTEAMDWSTFTSSTFKLTGDTTGAIAGTIGAGNDGTRKITFTPNSALPANEWFTARVTSGVKDKAGNPLAADYTWRFLTVDTSSPVISSVTPADGSKLKLESRTITVNATDNVAVTRVEFYWRDVTDPTTWIKFGEDTTSGDGWKATLNTATMVHDGQYDIKALAYDAAGNPPAQAIVQYGIDKTPPSVTLTVPFNGATNVARTPIINAIFSEDMDPASFIDDTTVYLTRYGSFEKVNMDLSYNPVNKTASMVMPTNSNLNYNTTYTATITTSVKDLAGNNLTSTKSWNFTTELDLIPPKLTVTEVTYSYISPLNSDGSKDSTSVNFNIDQTSTVHLEVADTGGALVYKSADITANEQVINSLTWDGKMDNGQYAPDGSYRLKIIATDPSNNTSRTRVRQTIVVDNSSPWARSAVAESRTRIKLTFSEPMDVNSVTNKFYYTVTEKNNPGVSLPVTQVTMLDSMSVRIETGTSQRTDRTLYTVKIENVQDKQGNLINSPSTVDLTGFNAHGFYSVETPLCGYCHATHAGKGGKLISKSNIKSQCYSCHGNGGQSTFNTVQIDFSQTSHHPVDLAVQGGTVMMSCEDCHSVHGVEKTPGNLYPKLLQTTKNPGGQKIYEGNEYCWACHGTGSTLRAPYGDKQTYYPAEGTSHNKASLAPASGSNIKCLACHAKHGSTLPKLLSTQVNGQTVTGNNRSLCYACHQNGWTTDFASWNGQTVYDSAANKHQTKQCQECHDSHTTQNGKFLKNTYDTTIGLNRTKAYNPADFQSCNGACHYHETTVNTSLTQTTLDGDGMHPTGFWDGNLYQSNPTDPRVNLHNYHLQLENWKPGKGNAVCKECHRPHGTLAAENPTENHQVGFPADTVTATVYATPRWVENTSQDKHGGTCYLTCHGKTHNATTYSASAQVMTGNRDGNCYSCHGTGTTPANLDIQTLMGDNTGGGKTYRHIVGSVDQDFVGGNGCLNSCHDKHSNFDSRGKASNTLMMDWNTGTQTMSNDYKLCQSCHKSTPTPGAAAISSNFPSTGHSYEATYHDYGVGGGTFKANCLKCHTPHGSTLDNLISFQNGSAAFGRDSTTITNGGKDNSVCLACHTIYRATAANWPGSTVYNHATNAHGTKNLSGTAPVNGYCIDCHNPHGKDDGSGLIPKLLLQRGTSSCYTCHNATSGTVPDWTGSVGYNAGAHKTYAADGTHGTGYCENCHAAHGKDDGTGKPIPDLLAAKEEASCFGGATACHGTNGKNAANGNKNIDVQTVYNSKTYKHGNIASASSHTSSEFNIGAGWAATGRHAECEDCHNSHSAKPTTTPASLSAGDVKDSGIGVWGITLKDGSNNPISDPSTAALWPTPAIGSKAAPANTSITVISQAVKEWQVCAKCHSAWAYGATKPAATKWDGTADTGGQTDVLADFNPNNLGHHAVIAQGKNQPGAANANFANTFVTPRWGPGARVACSDCHSSDVSTDTKGTHGSNFRYLLVKNTSGSGDTNVFCLNCHRITVYGDPSVSSPANASWSRVSHPLNTGHINASNNHISGIWCLNCHMGDSTGGSHGSNKGPGASTKAGYVNENLGKRLMNGAAITSYNTTAGNVACYTQGSATSLSQCSKGHGGQAAGTNYNY